MSRLIHINGANIRTNNHRDKDLPVFEIGYFEQSEYKSIIAKTVELQHQGVTIATIHYRPKSPLESGARVWIETEDCCTVVTEQTNGEDMISKHKKCKVCGEKHHTVRYSALFDEDTCEAVCDQCHRRQLHIKRLGSDRELR